MKFPYPTKNLAIAYDGTGTCFPDLVSAPGDVRRAIREDVVTLRQAAALEVGEDPARFAVLEALPTPPMVAVLKYGPRPTRSGALLSKAGAGWRAGILEAHRSGKLGPVLKSGPVKSAVDTFEQGAEEFLAEHGGDEARACAALEKILQDHRAGLARKNGASFAQTATVPAQSAVVESAPPLHGRAMAAAAFRKQAASFPSTRKTEVGAKRPDLSGLSLAAAAINEEFGIKPSVPPPRNLPAMPPGQSRAAAAFNAQMKNLGTSLAAGSLRSGRGPSAQATPSNI